MGTIALMIIAIAFAVLVIFLVIVLLRISKMIGEANRTVKLVSSDVDVLLHQADGLMTKANTLLEDVNGKVATIDPLFTAVADLSQSISDVNGSTRKLVARLNRPVRSKTATSAILAAKTAKKFFVKKDGASTTGKVKTKAPKTSNKAPKEEFSKATVEAFDQAIKDTTASASPENSVN